MLPIYDKLTSVGALTGNESPMVTPFLYPKCKKLAMFTDAKKKEAHDFIICITERDN